MKKSNDEKVSRRKSLAMRKSDDEKVEEIEDDEEVDEDRIQSKDLPDRQTKDHPDRQARSKKWDDVMKTATLLIKQAEESQNPFATRELPQTATLLERKYDHIKHRPGKDGGKDSPEQSDEEPQEGEREEQNEEQEGYGGFMKSVFGSWWN